MLFFATAVVILVVAADALRGSPTTVSFPASAPVNQRLVPKGVYAVGQRTDIVVEHPSARERRLALAITLVPLLLAAPVLWLVRGIAASVRHGDPFGRENVRRLRAIGGLLLVGVTGAHFVVQALYGAIADPYLTSPFASASRQGLLAPDGDGLPWAGVLGGLGAFVLAQVFADGVRLREDADATI